ncbi:50S ribosomal protein L1 [Candidatus Berkelbacteria bacterium]|nr:50S ribosomal protein L1 [Candidatus Berkelbacteria bacterium]
MPETQAAVAVAEVGESGQEKPATAKQKVRVKRQHQAGRSTRYLEAKQLVDYKKSYALSEAVELAKKTSWAKFDGTVELHIKTQGKKGQDALRGTLVLPAGNPKSPNVVVADDAIVEQIAKGKFEFDVLLAEPAMMPKLAKVAKVLGPKGLMPSPKAGTVVDDAKKALEEFAKGKIEYRSDSLGNIHVAVGKVSWDSAKIQSNIEAIIKVIPRTRIANVTLSSTMGPGIAVVF